MLELSFNEKDIPLSDINITYEKRNPKCSYIKVATPDTTKYISYSAKEAIEAHGNTFLAQPFASVLSKYYKDKKEDSSLELEIYLLTLKDGALNKYNQNIYRLIKTINIKILNEKDLNLKTIQPFRSLMNYSHLH